MGNLIFRALTELIGPYGIRLLNETLMWHVGSQVRKKILPANTAFWHIKINKSYCWLISNDQVGVNLTLSGFTNHNLIYFDTINLACFRHNWSSGRFWTIALFFRKLFQTCTLSVPKLFFTLRSRSSARSFPPTRMS